MEKISYTLTNEDIDPNVLEILRLVPILTIDGVKAKLATLDLPTLRDEAKAKFEFYEWDGQPVNNINFVDKAKYGDADKVKEMIAQGGIVLLGFIDGGLRITQWHEPHVAGFVPITVANKSRIAADMAKRLVKDTLLNNVCQKLLHEL